GPGTSPLTVTTTDPSGDTYGSLAVQWDLTALTLTRDTGGIDFAIDLTSNALSPVSGDSDAVYGEIDFDPGPAPTPRTLRDAAECRRGWAWTTSSICSITARTRSSRCCATIRAIPRTPRCTRSAPRFRGSGSRAASRAARWAATTDFSMRRSLWGHYESRRTS